MVNLITEKTAIKPTLSPYLQTYVTPPVQEEPKVAPVQAPIQPVEVSDNSNSKNKSIHQTSTQSISKIRQKILKINHHNETTKISKTSTR
jgi:hypothetical protein